MASTNDLLAQGNALATAGNATLIGILGALQGTTPANPRGVKARVVGTPGGNVAVTFTWAAPAPGDSAVGYNLQVNNPDGSPFAPSVSLPVTQQSYVLSMPDGTGTYTMVLTALNSAGVPDANPPSLPFVPHTTAPPPPPPGDPTGLAYTVADA